MSKKHFIDMAARFKRLRETGADPRTLERCIAEFCSVSAEANPRFDRHRFILATGGVL